MNIILIIWTGFFILDFIVDWLLGILNINTILKNKGAVPENLTDSIDEETYRRSVDYSLCKANFGLFSGVQERVMMILILVSQAVGILDGILGEWRLSAYWHGLLFLVISSWAVGLIRLPASLYAKFVIEEKFGFNTSSFRTCIKDAVLGMIVGIVLLIALLGGLYAVMALSGGYWWLTAWGFVGIFQFLLTILYPMIIAPLFNKFEALPEGELKNCLDALAERCRFAVKGIFVMDGSRRSRHSNAYFTGFGKFRRIVIFDTLIESLSIDELEAVLAHEIGHWKHGHIRKQLIIGIVLNLALFALAGWALNWPPLFQAFGFAAPSLHGFIVLTVFFATPIMSFFSPLTNSLARKYEYQADGFACKQTGGPDAMKSALLNLSRDNLSNLTPHPAYSFWHYSHPALSERLKALC